MALSAQSQNLISDTIAQSEQLLQLRFELEILIARWELTDVGSILEDLEMKENTTFAHLGKEKIFGTVDGFKEVLASIGNIVDGNAAKFVKMKG